MEKLSEAIILALGIVVVLVILAIAAWPIWISLAALKYIFQ